MGMNDIEHVRNIAVSRTSSPIKDKQVGVMSVFETRRNLNAASELVHHGIYFHQYS